MNDRLVDEMSLIAHESKAQQTAKRVVAKLHNDVPRQLIKVVIQAKVNNKVIARADIKAFRKDVTAKCVSQRQLTTSSYPRCFAYSFIFQWRF